MLDPILADAAAEAEAGADVRFRTGLKALLRRADGRVSGAVLRGPDGNAFSLTDDLVIGADGAASTVARLVEAGFEQRGRHASAVVYGYWSGLAVDGYHWHYRPGCSVGVIPTTGGQHCVFAAMPPARLKGHAKGDLAGLYRAVLAECAPALAARLEACRLESRLWAFAGRPGYLRRCHGPGWALVGDAGYFKDPITAHGLTDALRDAELLAGGFVARGEAGLADYAARRAALSLDLLWLTDRIAAFDWDLAELARLHQALNKAMQPEVAHLAALRADSAGQPVQADRPPARFIEKPTRSLEITP